jgi:hypothetical protein
MLLPGAFSPVFGPGSIPTTMPRALPLLIPAGYAGVDAYLKGPTVIEDIARLLEKLGGPSEVLRGPVIRKSNPSQDKMLTPGEIGKLEDAGIDIHELKGKTRTGRIDLYKRPNGDVVIKPKGGGKMQGEETGYNLNDL